MFSHVMSGRILGAVLLSAAVLQASCSRLNKRNDGGGQGGSTVDEGGGNNEPVEATNPETGGSVTAEKESLSGDDTIQVEEGVELATDVTGAYLTLPPGVERGGNSISVFPANADTKILTYITVKVPIEQKDSASLLQDNRVLVLFYKVKKPDGSVIIGARPVTPDQIVGKEVVYQTPYFGVFQAGYIKSPLAKPVEKTVGGEVFSKTEEKAADPFTWSPVTATITGTSIKFTAAYTSASPISHCLVRITLPKGSQNNDEVQRASVSAPEYTLDPAEPGVTYFAHFSCWTEQGVNTPVNSSPTGVTIQVAAPVALNSSVTIEEDTAVSVSLTYDSNGAKPDACTVKGVESLQPATCVCANAGCSASIIGTKDYFGPAALSFTLSSKGVESAAKRVAVTITAVDDAPVAFDRNLGAVLVNSYETIILPYTDAEEHPATACTTPQTTNVLMITSGCSCTGGVCKVSVQYGGGTGAGLIGFIVQANGLSSNTGTINFNVQTTVPPAVRVLNLDFAYPNDTTPIPLLDKIKLSGTASINDYEFHLVSAPSNAAAQVKDMSAADRQNGPMSSPSYFRGDNVTHFDKFSFALKHKTSGIWISNASLENPAWAYTCSAGEFNSWNQLPQGPGGQILLCSVDQLIDLFNQCRNSTGTACSSSIRQIADINFSTYNGVSWSMGIGWGTNFLGSFNGGGHLISNYKPDNTGIGFYVDGGGLFGRLGDGVVVENIRLSQAEMNVSAGSNPTMSNWGLLVGRAVGNNIIIRNIEIRDSRVIPGNDSFNIGGVVGKASGDVLISDIDIDGLDIAFPVTAFASHVAPVFGLAEQGAKIERAAVESGSSIGFTTVNGSPSRVGGLGGVLQSGAKLQDSYTRATINCSGADMRFIGKILSLADTSAIGLNSDATLIENVYAQISHAGDCYSHSISVGTVAAEKGQNAPTLSRIHFQSSGVSDTYAFGNQNFFYSEVIGHTPGGLDNTEFNNWDFVNTWIKLTNRPPQLRR